MPVGTYGTVKAMTPEQLESRGRADPARQHLSSVSAPRARGDRGARRAAPLHALGAARFSPTRAAFKCGASSEMRKITEEGASFRSPIDGAPVFLSPEESMRMQRMLGSDIAMSFDECTALPGERGRGARLDGAVDALGTARPSGLLRDASPPARCSASCREACMPTLRAASLAALEEIGFAGSGDRRAGGRRERNRAPRGARGPVPADAGSQAAVSHGRRPTRGHTRSGAARHGHVRLRDADTPRPQRSPVYAPGRAQHP